MKGGTNRRMNERTNERPTVFYRTSSPSGPLPKKRERKKKEVEGSGRSPKIFTRIMIASDFYFDARATVFLSFCVEKLTHRPTSLSYTFRDEFI